MNNWIGRLQSKMKELDLTQEELAKKLGLTRSAVAHYLHGTRQPPLKQFAKLASVLNVDPSWLQFGKSIAPTKSVKPSSNLIPIINWNEILDFDSSVINSSKGTFLEYFNFNKENCYALKIKGDSMVSLNANLSFNPDSYIIVDQNKTPKHGDFVVLVTDKKKEGIFRQYIEEGDTVYLKPLNQQYPLLELDRHFKICGIVIANINMLI